MQARHHAQNKRSIHERLQLLCGASAAGLKSSLRALHADEAVCSVSHPINDLAGHKLMHSGCWRPLRAALPDIERRDEIVIAGAFAGTELVAMMGHYEGTLGAALMGIPPTGKRFTIRVMDFYRLDKGLLAENWVPIDIIDILQQLGIDVFARVLHLTDTPRLTLAEDSPWFAI